VPVIYYVLNNEELRGIVRRWGADAVG